MKTIFCSTARLLVALSVTAGVSASALAQSGPLRTRSAAARNMMHGFAAEPLAADDLRAPERAFLGKAVEISRQHMRLAEVGASKADSSEVRSQSLQLAADYRRLSEGIQDLVRRKGGIAGAPVGDTSENYPKLQEKAGADFDREFALVVTNATEEALTLFEQAAANAKDPDVRTFASAQLPILRQHRNRAVALREALE